MSKIRVLVADDHSLVREGISAFLKLSEDIEVVAEAADGIEAIEKTKKFHPDVVLLDISMPRLGGYEAALEIKKFDQGIKILVLTQYDDKEYITRFLKAGASGYLLKRAVGSDLVTAIHAVKAGETYLYPAIATKVVDSLRKVSRPSVRVTQTPSVVSATFNSQVDPNILPVGGAAPHRACRRASQCPDVA